MEIAEGNFRVQQWAVVGHHIVARGGAHCQTKDGGRGLNPRVFVLCLDGVFFIVSALPRRESEDA
jgi:hypothetical protein